MTTATGLGRGDSALSQIGLRAQPPGAFERSLEQLQGLLRGEQVSFGATTGSIRWLKPRAPSLSSPSTSPAAAPA
jgi:hypothetical protein